MNITEAIKHLITTHKKVSVPGLGTFEYRIIPADIDELNISAPSEVLKFDSEHDEDNLQLQHYLSQQESITETEAAETIALFVRDLNSKLTKESTISLKGLGTFSLEENKNINFLPDSDALFAYDFYGLDDFEMQGLEENKPGQNIAEQRHDNPQLNTELEKDIDLQQTQNIIPMETQNEGIRKEKSYEWILVHSEDFFDTQDEADKKNKTEYQSQRKALLILRELLHPDIPEWEGWTLVDLDDFFETRKSAEIRNQISYNNQYRLIGYQAEEQKKNIQKSVWAREEEGEEEESKRFGGLWKMFLWLVVIAALAYGVYYFLPILLGDKAEVQETTPIVLVPETLTKSDTTPVAPPKPVIRQGLIKTQSEPIQLDAIPVIKPDPNIKYYLVIGSFETQRRSKTFMRELGQKGVFSTLVTYGESHYRVMVGGYADLETTTRAREEAQKLPMCEGAWILPNH